MPYQIRPAHRSEAKPLVGLYSESGCGKTLSALYLARGFVGPTGKIVMIETEAGRGEVYADVLPGGYQVCSMRDTFSPEKYGDAIKTVEKDAPEALIIDSASHEWEGSGGVLAMAAENEVAGKKGVLIWQGPKLAHQRYFVLRLLATPIPLVIICMRAKYPMKEIKVDGKKEWARAEVVEPVQSDGILYELMIHGWIDRDHKFRGTKYTRDDLRQVIRDGEAISIKTGELLAAWARGGGAARAAALAEAAKPAAPAAKPAVAPNDDDPIFGKLDPTVLAEQIAAEIAKWPRQPPADMRARIVRGLFQCAEAELAAQDVAVLDDGLNVLRGYTHGKQEATRKVNLLARSEGAA